MIEYFADAGPYEDAKSLARKIQDLFNPELMDLLQEAIREVAIQVERDTRAEVVLEIELHNSTERNDTSWHDGMDVAAAIARGEK